MKPAISRLLDGGKMKNRLWWSFTSLAALLCLLLITADVSLAQGQLVVTNGTGAGRSPETVYTPPTRIPAGTVAQGLQFEGFNSNNYLVLAGEQLGTPNPDIAVGPNDMIIIVNRNVARVPNINSSEMKTPFPPGSIYAPGANSLGLNPGSPNFSGGAGALGSLNAPGTPITNRARLDAWLGASIQASVCPTLPRTPISCVIDNAMVRYDQLHGRFLVLMTAVDTGIVNFGAAPANPRRASWVLFVSRFAVITHPAGAFGAGSAATAFGTSDPFISPATNPPAGGGTTGGPNDNNWMVYYGRNDTKRRLRHRRFRWSLWQPQRHFDRTVHRLRWNGSGLRHGYHQHGRRSEPHRHAELPEPAAAHHRHCRFRHHHAADRHGTSI